MESQEKLENRIKELELKLESNNKEDKKIFITLIKWFFILSIFIFLWINIKPILNKVNNLLDISTETVQKINKGANTSNEILDKVKHPIDTTVNAIGF